MASSRRPLPRAVVPGAVRHRRHPQAERQVRRPLRCARAHRRSRAPRWCAMGRRRHAGAAPSWRRPTPMAGCGMTGSRASLSQRAPRCAYTTRRRSLPRTTGGRHPCCAATTWPSPLSSSVRRARRSLAAVASALLPARGRGASATPIAPHCSGFSQPATRLSSWRVQRTEPRRGFPRDRSRARARRRGRRLREPARSRSLVRSPLIPFPASGG